MQSSLTTVDPSQGIRSHQLPRRLSTIVQVIWATPLYECLRQCNASSLDKTVLDCGAAGGCSRHISSTSP
jgi:hypothetical protein